MKVKYKVPTKMGWNSHVPAVKMGTSGVCWKWTYRISSDGGKAERRHGRDTRRRGCVIRSRRQWGIFVSVFAILTTMSYLAAISPHILSRRKHVNPGPFWMPGAWVRYHRHSEHVHNYLQRDLLPSLRDAGQYSQHKLLVLDVGWVNDFYVDMVSLEEGTMGM
jgi:hypothetical protein